MPNVPHLTQLVWTEGYDRRRLAGAQCAELGKVPMPTRVLEPALVCSGERSRRGGHEELVTINRLFTSGAALLVTTAGCSTFDDLELHTDAGAHVGVFNEPKGECQSAQPPRNPSVPEVASMGLDLWLAMQSVDFGEGDENGDQVFRQMGFDLDRTCTGLGDGASCAESSWATADHADGPDGRDNAVGALFYQTNQDGLGSWTDSVTNVARAGILSIVIRVRDYNGVGTDPSVEVSWYAGAFRPPVLAQDASTPPAPRWDGTDEWLIFDEWLDPTPDSNDEYAPKYHDPQAYVTADVLVAHFREVLTATGLFRDAILSGRLVKTDSGAWALRDATFAGRLRLDDVLGVIELVTVDAQPVCTTSEAYLGYKTSACSYTDIHSAAPSDSSAPDDPSLPCDALSAAWTMNVEPVEAGGVEPWDTFWARPRTRCPAGTSPREDTCDTLPAPDR